MNTQGPLSPEALIDLVVHLYREGEQAYQQQRDPQASIWFAQCLQTVQSLPEEKQVDWIGTLLFNLGKLKAQAGQRPQAVGFLEAAANVQLGLPQGEGEAGVAQAVGQLLAVLGYPAHARHFLERAQRVYREIGLNAQSEAAAQQVQQLGAEARRWGGSGSIAPTHRFEIRVGQQVAGRLTVGEQGRIEWGQGEAIEPPPALGVVIPWNVHCMSC